MQVTGNNSVNELKILSVRLRQGGLSFSFAGDGGATLCDSIAFRKEVSLAEQLVRVAARFRSVVDVMQVFVDTADTVFVPAELLEDPDPELWLRRAGIAVGESCVAMTTETVQDVCAVVVAEAAVVEALRLLPVRRVRFFSPLHELLAAWERRPVDGGGLLVYPTGDNVYVVRYDEGGRLVLAEVYPCRGTADLVWCLTALAEQEQGRRADWPVFLYGGNPVDAGRLRRYFRHVQPFPMQKKGGK